MFSRTIVFLAVGLLAMYTQAMDLQDIRFTEVPGGGVEVRAQFSKVPAEPKGYVITQPARIVFDFPGVVSSLKQKRYTLDIGSLKSAVVLTAQARTRMIFNLTSPESYSTKVEGNTLVMLLGNDVKAVAVGSSKTNEPRKSASSPAIAVNAKNTITDVDFRRGDNGSGKLLLTLSNPGTAVNVNKSSKKVTMAFADTHVPESLRRRLDVIDFATPVRFIETRQKGKGAQISVEATGRYDYLAYQAGGVYVVEISPLTEEKIAQQKEQFSFSGEKLSLNFQDIEVRKVLEIIADFTDLNLVASDTVTGNITLRLENVPWDQALELVLKSKGLDKRQAGNVLMVAPAAEIAERERQELESRKQLQELEPLETEFIRVHYAKAQDVVKLVRRQAEAEESGVTGILSSRGTATVDERTNSIILTDIADNIEGIRKLVEKVDVPVRQVMIEARIVSATDTFLDQLAFFLGANYTGGQPLNQSGSAFANGLTRGAGQPGLGFSYIRGDYTQLNLELVALENDGYGETVSQPRVLTSDKQKAKIEDGQEIPFTSSDGDDVTTVFKEAVLGLEVTPQITPDNHVILELKINRDSVDSSTLTADGPPINVTEVTTTALVKDGDTIVLGGLYTQEKSTSESKVPLLGDIPVLGALFKNTIRRDDRREILIFITPRILSDDLAP